MHSLVGKTVATAVCDMGESGWPPALYLNMVIGFTDGTVLTVDAWAFINDGGIEAEITP